MKDNLPGCLKAGQNKTKFSRKQQIVDTSHSKQNRNKMAATSFHALVVPKPLQTLGDHVTILVDIWWQLRVCSIDRIPE